MSKLQDPQHHHYRQLTMGVQFGTSQRLLLLMIQCCTVILFVLFGTHHAATPEQQASSEVPHVMCLTTFPPLRPPISIPVPRHASAPTSKHARTTSPQWGKESQYSKCSFKIQAHLKWHKVCSRSK